MYEWTESLGPIPVCGVSQQIRIMGIIYAAVGPGNIDANLIALFAKAVLYSPWIVVAKDGLNVNQTHSRNSG